MKTAVKKIENYESEVTVEIEAEELEKTKKRAAKKIAERINIPGFRKGKVPYAILEKTVGKDYILDEAAEMLVQKAAKDIVNDLNLIPVTEMKPKTVTLEDGKDFVFTLTFTPYPEVKLGEYKNIEVEKEVKPVADEDVDHRLEHMREHHADLTDAAEGDAVVDGDFITLDFVGTINGEKFEGGEGKDYPLNIGSHSFIDNFEDQLIGLKVGEEKDVKVTFPEQYHDKKLADKAAVFHCKIDSIKHKKLPELDDEFAKKASKFQTLDELKEDIRKNLEANADRAATVKQQEDIIQKAVDNMTVDLPPVMIENRISQMIRELQLQLQSQNMTIEQYMNLSNIDMDKLRENYREAAEKNVLIDMLCDEVARVEDIKVDQYEWSYEIAVMAQMYRTTPKQIVKILRENRQEQNILANIRRRKVMQFIVNGGRLDSETDSDTKTSETDLTKDVKNSVSESDVKSDEKVTNDK